MQITALALFAALVSASPVYKRQDASSVVASATSAIESVTSEASSAASSVAAAPSASSSAASDYGTGLLAALRDREANTLADLLEPMAGALVPMLEGQGPFTIFAPGDEYLAAVPESVTSNQTLLGEILMYHIVSGDYPASGLVTNVTNVAPSLLQMSMLGEPYTTLPVAFVQNQFGTTEVIGQNASVLGNATYENVLVKLIDGVLLPPGNVSSVLTANGGDALAGLLSQFLPDVVQTLDTTQGVTLFAPENAAVEAAVPTLAPLIQSDPMAVMNAVTGHAVPGVYFSTNITAGDVTSVAGTPITFAVNDTGVFVTGNGVTAQVVRTDYVAQNGVVHFIDSVLFSGSAGGASGSASSAVASATDAVGGVAESATSAVASITSAAASAVPSA